MAKVKIRVFWRHVMADSTEVEVEVDFLKGAPKAKLVELAQKQALKKIDENRDAYEWKDGEVIDGEYVAGAVTDENGKQLAGDPDLSLGRRWDKNASTTENIEKLTADIAKLIRARG